MRVIVTSALVLLVAGAGAATASEATSDAQHWVAIVDAGDYAKSWSAAGEIFRQRITQDAWVSAVVPVRKPLGAVVSRTVSKEQPTKSLPGVPDGDYDVLVFATTFANKKDAVETVVLAREADGWRVDGYFIK